MSTDPLAQAAMVAYCGWDPTVVVTDGTVVLDGNGTELVALPSMYVTAVTSVAVTDNAGTVHTYASTDDPATIGPGATMIGWSVNGMLTCKDPLLGRVFPEGQGNVTVAYSGGYSPVPDDLAAALAHLSARMAAVTGATAVRLGSGAISYGQAVAAGGLLLVEQMVFDRYRLPRAA